MTDTMSPAKRGRLMSRIRSTSTQPEVLMEEMLVAAGADYDAHPDLPAPCGHPDFLLWDHEGARDIAVFVDGCFWHSCPRCRHRVPSTHNGALSRWWRRKLSANQARHREVTAFLRTRGWGVVRIWEHELRDDAGRVAAVRRVLRAASRPPPGWS